MSGAVCLRCLARPTVGTVEQTSLRLAAPSAAAAAAAAAAFSTSAPLSAVAAKKGVAVKKQSTASFSKQGRVGKGGVPARSGKPPAEGERKALRKKIVLSNTNAIEVLGLENLTAENLHNAAIQGQVVGLTNEVIDALRAAEAFKHTQGWKLFRRPTTLVRKETVDMANLLQDIEANKTAVRKVITGDRSSGKSVLLLQAKAMALLKGWVVVHIPEAKELVFGSTSYMPTKSGLYDQPHYTAALLGQIAKANHNLLTSMRLSQQHELPVPVQSNIDLARFAMMGANDPDIACDIYKALWVELTTPSAQGKGMTRPPVVFTLDSIAHLMRDSAYLDADVKPIHAHDFSLVDHFLKLLSGKQKLPNGGVILAADSGSNRPGVPAFDHAVARNAALAQKKEAPVWDPWVRVDERVLNCLSDAGVMDVKGLSREEARSIMDYYAKSGMLRQTVNDTLVGEKWTLSGGGIIGELEKSAIRTRI